jgi:hypothetical protein
MSLSETKTEKEEALLAKVCGHRLTSVDFVLDYLILGFDGKGALTTMVWPEILEVNSLLKFGMKEYRDRLCALITEVVRAVTVSADQTILISFRNEAVLRIPLNSRKASGEKAIFTAPKHHLYVWS